MDVLRDCYLQMGVYLYGIHFMVDTILSMVIIYTLFLLGKPLRNLKHCGKLDKGLHLVEQRMEQQKEDKST